jgi:hypothetical protein
VQERIQQELDLLKTRYPELVYVPEGQWVRIPTYPLPGGWNRTATEIAFQIPPSYPGTPPYGIYVPAGIQHNGKSPGSYKEPADNRPPFPGDWGIFSWQPDDGQWRPTTDPRTGPNLLNWVDGFATRFREGV